jgi:hypothetical protein
VSECVNGLAHSIKSIGDTYDGSAGKMAAISKVVPILPANCRD